MEKPTPAQHPIHDLFSRRWSQRAIDDRPIEPGALASLFEAARWAPSSNNAQPWRFLVATTDATAEYNRLLGCLVEGNLRWAHRAPVLILSVAKLAFDDGSPNRHAMHDVGLATENLVLQATALGLTAHQMAGFHIEKARTEFKIPPGFEPVVIIAVGYPGDVSLLSDRLREREEKPRLRLAITDFVFAEQWGQTSPLVR